MNTNNNIIKKRIKTLYFDKSNITAQMVDDLNKAIELLAIAQTNDKQFESPPAFRLTKLPNGTVVFKSMPKIQNKRYNNRLIYNSSASQLSQLYTVDVEAAKRTLQNKATASVKKLYSEIAKKQIA